MSKELFQIIEKKKKLLDKHKIKLPLKEMHCELKIQKKNTQDIKKNWRDKLQYIHSELREIVR